MTPASSDAVQVTFVDASAGVLVRPAGAATADATGRVTTPASETGARFPAASTATTS
ncbi:hypothetical protein AB0C70_31235 [Streptomyces sp. NPDC048564]|uniref:hypothetical protein n=1 Tax=Streptomyces sp. NPDC048564 TaxID=3155760 RepID=UPI0034303DE1